MCGVHCVECIEFYCGVCCWLRAVAILAGVCRVGEVPPRCLLVGVCSIGEVHH